MILSACGRVEEVRPPVPETPVVPQKSEYETEVEAMRNADFDYIFVFKRRDGNPMTSDDKKYVRNNSHYATNRFTLSDDEKTIFAGSNFKFEKTGLDLLKDRFEVTDLSRSPEEIEKKRVEREEKAKKKEERRKREEKDSIPRKASRKPVYSADKN